TVSKVDPIFERPILLFAAASGMNRKNWPRQIAKEIVRRLSILRGRKNIRGKIDNLYPKLPDRPRQLPGGLPIIIELRRPVDQIFYGALAPGVVKDCIRIVEVA